MKQWRATWHDTTRGRSLRGLSPLCPPVWIKSNGVTLNVWWLTDVTYDIHYIKQKELHAPKRLIVRPSVSSCRVFTNVTNPRDGGLLFSEDVAAGFLTQCSLFGFRAKRRRVTWSLWRVMKLLVNEDLDVAQTPQRPQRSRAKAWVKTVREWR